MSNDNNNFDEVTARLCAMVSDVGSKVFSNEHSTDCFCGESKSMSRATVNELILDWIEEAINGAIESHNLEKPQSK